MTSALRGQPGAAAAAAGRPDDDDGAPPRTQAPSHRKMRARGKQVEGMRRAVVRPKHARRPLFTRDRAYGE